MSARLIVVTSNYPYRYTGGELMFVAPEVLRLCTEFESLTVVPQHAVGPRQPTPPGVSVDTSLSTAWRRWLWWSHLLAPIWPGFWSELARARRHGGWLGCARAWRWAAVAHLTWRWARRACASDEPLLCYTYWRGGSTLAFVRLSQERSRVAVVTRVHGHELYEDRFDPPFQPWTAVYRQLALTVPISGHGLAHLRAAGVPEARLWLSRLGTECSAPAPASADGVLRIVSSGWMVPVKRVPLLARALAMLSLRRPQARFHWTHFGDGVDMPRVRRALEGAGANLEVRLAGQVEHAAVIAHLAGEAVDLFVLLSANEGLPVALQEAIAAGIPVLATDVGGVAEIVGADNGILLPSDPAPEAVVSALERMLITDTAETRSLRRGAARTRWASDFDAGRNHARFARRLRALAEEI